MRRLVEADRGERRRKKTRRRSRARFVSGDKSFSLGSPVNQRELSLGGGGAVNQLEEEGGKVEGGEGEERRQRE